MSKLAMVAVLVLAAGCTVRTEDMMAWEGQPVAALDYHPIFAALPVVKTRTSDGGEIRNYVNGRNVQSCSSFANFGTYASAVQYQGFMNCMGGFAACNNVFTIKNGKVLSYSPIGTGGARCFTDERVKPGFRGAANI